MILNFKTFSYRATDILNDLSFDTDIVSERDRKLILRYFIGSEVSREKKSARVTKRRHLVHLYEYLCGKNAELLRTVDKTEDGVSFMQYRAIRVCVK